MGYRLKLILIASFCILLLALGLGRLTRTAEWIAAFGNDKARADLCRAIPTLSEWRRARLLAGLLRDESAEVVSSAITACGTVPVTDTPTIRKRLWVVLAKNPGSGVLATKAGEVLLSYDPPHELAITLLRARVVSPEFRAKCPRLIAALAAFDLPGMDAAAREKLMNAALDEADPAHGPLQELIRDNVEQFRPWRDRFFKRLTENPPEATRCWLVACLGALDGSVRGMSAADWVQEQVATADPDALHAFEAEWATEIQPNYLIREHEGVRCLALGEGAGGYMGWLKGMDGTVDIGSARFSLFAPKDGRYTVWSRVYLDDKCGNSFGFWLGRNKLTNFPDKDNTLDQWHWLPLNMGKESALKLKAGFHPVRLMAWEDAVYIDRFALVPEGMRPDELPEAAAVRWDPALSGSISFSPERQAQSRGTTQTVVVWLRRATPELTEGTLALSVPEPFRVEGASVTHVRFEQGNPLARTSFLLRLPADAVAGEGLLRAVYTDVNGDQVEGAMILGAQFDWLTTGPLEPDCALDRRLSNVAGTGRQKYRKENWTPYPENGYDSYRRLTPESAWGNLRDKIIYLCADIEVDDSGEYMGLLTSDDQSSVYLDDRLLIAQQKGGPGEGRLVMQPLRLEEGKHRLFVRWTQADFADPKGPDAGRHSFNNCSFKLLLRRDRHRHAPEIRGLPHPLRKE